MPPVSSRGGDGNDSNEFVAPETETPTVLSPDLTQPEPAEAVVDSVKLRLVTSFGAGDSFTYQVADGTRYTVGTQPTEVPREFADEILAAARDSAVHVEAIDDDTSKEG